MNNKFHENVECPLCGPYRTEKLFSEDPFRIVSCQGCGLVYTLPRLSSAAIQQMYQVNYWNSPQAKEFGYTNYLDDSQLYLKTFRLRSQIVERYKPIPGKILEIGSAAGFFLKVMAEKGWQTTGVEISALMVDYARKHLKLPDIRLGNLEEQNFAPASFDAIALWDVIEHLEAPRWMLTQVRKLLKDDGILIIETQNVESIFAKLMGKSWHHYKHTEHLWHFSPQTITSLLTLEKFEILELSPRLAGKYISINFLIERVARIHPLLSKFLSSLSFMGKVNFYVNPRDEMILVARKMKTELDIK